MFKIILILLALTACSKEQPQPPQQTALPDQAEIQQPLQQPVIINQQPQQSSLSDVLMPGMVGYMMGRNSSSNNTPQIIHRERVIYRDAPVIAQKQPALLPKPAITLPNKSMVTKSGFNSFSRRASSYSRKR
jgi:hypothetical protein